jgi:hypothetical protein
MLPPVLNNQECTKCFQSKICSLNSVSTEIQRHQPEEYFDQYRHIAEQATDSVKAYYSRWMNAIQFE